METQQYFHKCGYPIIEVKKSVGLAVEVFFLDGETPFIQGKDGKRTPNLITRCPECDGFITSEKLLSEKPALKEKEKRVTGYIAARHGSLPSEK